MVLPIVPKYRSRGYPQLLGSTSATLNGMRETVGVREIRQRASELIRRAEAGEEIVVAVSGRPAARLVPLEASRKTWRDLAGITQVWETPTDPAWDSERRTDQTVDQTVTDPWERRDG